MYKDVYKNNSFNVKTANIFGLKAAVYWNELVKIASANTTFDEEAFFQVDREYVTEQTSLTEDEQLECDKMLDAGKVLTRTKDKNTIAIHIKEMISIITCENLSLLDEIAKTVRKATKEGQKLKKQNAILFSMQNFARTLTADTKMQTLLAEWVEIILAKQGYITQAVIESFYKAVTTYSADPIVRYTLIKTSTIHAYTDVIWAIQIYEKDHKTITKASTVTTSTQKAATQVNNKVTF